MGDKPTLAETTQHSAAAAAAAANANANAKKSSNVEASASQSLPSVAPSSPTGVDATTAHIEVIRHEEAARAAAFGRGVTILSTLGFIVAAVRKIELFERVMIMSAILMLIFAGAGVWWRSRDVSRYERRMFRLFGVAAAVSSMVLVYALGVFTPITVIIVLGLAFFVHGRDTRIIFPVAVGVIVVYALLAILVTMGVLPDRGVWKNPGVGQHISMTVIVTAVMVTQFALARSNHKAVQNALTKFQEAIRVARTREAELDEARDHLDAALRAGNGGRLTGTQIAGYRVGDIVGRGAMGEVYAAQKDADPSKLSAIKVLRHLDDDILTRRFVREAEIARKVRGPNLVEVRDTGQTGDGAVYIIMELLSGQDLAAILRDRTVLPLEELVKLITETAQGLSVLHEAGVIHRDLKPQNLFLTKQAQADEGGFDDPPTWKILDYGVSKMIGTGTVTENNLVGTPGYMSPEQAEGKEVDARSDVFSLGAVAYRALTGRRPFSGPDLPQILYQVVHGTPVRPRELLPTLPKEVETVLAVALAKKPADRYQTARDFADALRAAALGAPLPAPQSSPRLPAAKIAARAWRAEPTTLTMPRIEKGAPRAVYNNEAASSKRDAFPKPADSSGWPPDGSKPPTKRPKQGSVP